jgi:hypothetical protein
MNDTSQLLVTAATTAVMLRRDEVNRPLTVDEVGAVTTAAVLREIARLMNLDELDALADGPDSDWPDAGDLTLLANDIWESL